MHINPEESISWISEGNTIVEKIATSAADILNGSSAGESASDPAAGDTTGGTPDRYDDLPKEVFETPTERIVDNKKVGVIAIVLIFTAIVFGFLWYMRRKHNA